MSHLASPMHCWLDRLGRTCVALIAALGALYLSAYTTGWPNLPDPHRHRIQMQMPEQGCMRELP